jgi:hypothetical protein
MKNKSATKEKDSKASINMGGISNMIDNTSKIVIKAANILEEEIAKGIIAAKQMEEKLTDVTKLRSDDKEALLMRFRKDAHDIIDLLLDFTSIAVKNVSNISSQWISVKTESSGPEVTRPQKNPNIPMIKVPKELKQGEYFEMPLKLENESTTETKSLHFENSAFSGNGDVHLPANTISFDPNPLMLQPGSSGTVILKITIPSIASEGSYSCLIQAKNLNDLSAMLILKIVNG